MATITLVLVGAALLAHSDALAQVARHPFAVGANEGAAGRADVVSSFIVAQESGFYRLLTGAIKAVQVDGTAWALIGLSFAYGVFHAAGPGHGKAVIASYMLADETAFWRGAAISLSAALLQGFVAVAVVGIAALVFHAAARQMTTASNVIEIVSYTGMTALGAVLVFSKGMALWSLRDNARMHAAFAGITPSDSEPRSRLALVADDGKRVHRHGAGCCHAPDLVVSEIGSHGGWRNLLMTVVAAGLRPCSGAILVLVYSLAQGVFAVGAFAVAAMSLGTALTTGLLAGCAVFFKKIATKWSATNSPRAALALSLVEACAAFAILGLGLVLLVGALARTI